MVQAPPPTLKKSPLTYFWNPVNTLNSYHLPIIIKLPSWFPNLLTDPSRNYNNIRKARWTDFEVETELRFSREDLPTTRSAGEVRFRKILQAAAEHHIPSSFIR